MIPRSAAPVALFDSGVGGIGVLREVQKLLPHEQLLYFGDTANAPYGEREPQEIRTMVLKHAARLLQSAKALVLACNTATAVAADELRRLYPDIPIIGMEPALRPALSVSEHPHILVLATAATLHLEKFAHLRDICEKSATVTALPAPGIVRLVEAGLADSPQMEAYLYRLLDDLPTTPDALVLGCTHFPFAKSALRRVLGDVPCFDGAAGTARQLARRLREADLLAPTEAGGGVLLTSSAPDSMPLLIHLMKPQYWLPY